MLGRVSRCTISGNHFLRDDTITPVPCPTGPQMQPITPQVGVTMGNSSSDVLITGNVFRGMMQMAVCVNSSGALLIQTLSAHLSPFAQPFWPFTPHLSLSFSTHSIRPQTRSVCRAGAIDGCSGVLISSNIIDGAGHGGLGVWYQKCEGLSVLGNQMRGAPTHCNGHARNVLLQNNVTLMGPIPDAEEE